MYLVRVRCCFVTYYAFKVEVHGALARFMLFQNGHSSRGGERKTPFLEVDEAVSEVTTYMNMSGMLMLLMFASLGSSQG